MKLQSGKITNVPMEGSSSSGECAAGEESAGLSEQKWGRSNTGVCSPGQRESELGSGVLHDVKTFEEVRGECSSRGNCKRKKLSCRGQGSGKGKVNAEVHASGGG